MTSTASKSVATDSPGAPAPVQDFEALHARRLANWRQTPATRIRDVGDAAGEPARLGIVTLYPVSPEVPDQFHAYIGDPDAKTEMKWDSPSGEVYTWRWLLGRRGVAFYGVLVKRRPTWVSWDLLPAVLRVFGDGRMPDELYDSGAISSAAYRVARALDGAADGLSTGELRAAAGFPNGKEQRAAFLKAVDELDRRFLLARAFAEGDEEVHYALITERHRDHAVAADRLTREDALDAILRAYLPHAVYAMPAVIARHLGLPEEELRAGCERLAASDVARPVTLPDRKGTCYVVRDAG